MASITYPILHWINMWYNPKEEIMFGKNRKETPAKDIPVLSVVSQESSAEKVPVPETDKRARVLMGKLFLDGKDLSSLSSARKWLITGLPEPEAVRLLIECGKAYVEKGDYERAAICFKASECTSELIKCGTELMKASKYKEALHCLAFSKSIKDLLELAKACVHNRKNIQLAYRTTKLIAHLEQVSDLPSTTISTILEEELPSEKDQDILNLLNGG